MQETTIAPPPNVNHPTTTTEQPNVSKELIVSEPNATLYVSNIDWSIKKPILRRSLLALFSRHGKILEVVTLRREGLRGQAWIIFEEISSATSALRAENGFTFFDRNLKISYAREKSDRIAKRDGTYVPPDRRKKKIKAAAAAAVAKPEGNDAFVATTSGGDATIPPETDAPPSSSPPTTAPPPSTSPPTTTENAPSNIIFAQNLPSECNEMMLAMLFRQYAGYEEVRIPRAGLAFIEFDDEPHATLALKGLNGFKLTTDDSLDLRYGKTG